MYVEIKEQIVNNKMSGFTCVTQIQAQSSLSLSRSCEDLGQVYVWKVKSVSRAGEAGVFTDKMDR